MANGTAGWVFRSGQRREFARGTGIGIGMRPAHPPPVTTAIFSRHQKGLSGMRTKHISLVSLCALLSLAGCSAAGEAGPDAVDMEVGGDVATVSSAVASYDDDEDWVVANDFRPYINVRDDHKCNPLTFKESHSDFNTAHGDSYDDRELSDLQDFCRKSFSSDFVVVANVTRSTRSQTFRITYGIPFGKQYSHLQGLSDAYGMYFQDESDIEGSIGTHGKDAQYIVVDVVDGEVTSVWADLHKGKYVVPRDWLSMTGNHVNVYAGKYYNSLKLYDWTVSGADVLCDDEYTGDISCAAWQAGDAIDYYMNFGDPLGTTNGGYGQLVMASNACATGITSYTSEADGATYSDTSLTALQGYIGCSGESTPYVWSGSYMMQKPCYDAPYSLNGCDSGDLDGGDVCNASIDASENAWTTFAGTHVYMEPDVAGKIRLHSPNGAGFNDMPLTGETRLASITIRTGSRVDMVSATYTDGTTLSHGGTGGSQLPTLSELDTDPVVSVTMCDGKKDGDKRAGYIKLTTANGRTLEGGEGDITCETIAPSGKQLYGFYGRAGSELDVLGTYWGTRVTTPSVSNVSLTISGSTATGSYTFYDEYGLSDSSTFEWKRASSTSEAGTTFEVGDSTTHALETADHQKYLRFCVTPNNGYLSGTQVCSDWVSVGDLTPTASDVSLTVSGNQATGSYTLSGLVDSSTFEWWRTSDTSQAGTVVGTSSTHTLNGTDSNKYLRFCVTPYNESQSGTQVCSDWVSVGKLVSFYDSTNYEGTAIHVAYGKAGSGTCFNMSSFGFNNLASSFKFRAPATANGALFLFKDGGCSGTSKSYSITANTTFSISSIGQMIGSGWNNEISSFGVIW
ncbi:MAG: jacalin-like lectin [Myxococcota bacterium]